MNTKTNNLENFKTKTMIRKELRAILGGSFTDRIGNGNNHNPVDD